MIKRENIIMICASDIAGRVRGKGFPARDLEARRRFGVGWTPTNVMINCFGRIPATPFGALGDLNMVPAPDGDVVLDYGDGTPVEHMILANIVTLSGEPWSCCLRGFLSRAIEALQHEAGLRILASFEHEFWMDGPEGDDGDAYGVSRLRGQEAFAGDFVGALRANGVPPDTFLPEYGPGQFEITIDPAPALTAADDAIKLREICRSVARRHSRRVSFSPMVTLEVAGNGVHIHFSLQDKNGEPITYLSEDPGGLSPLAASFSAGILRHAPAIIAVTAPSAVSYARLQRHSWSPYYANMAERDREALLRICPIPDAPDIDKAKRFNIEFRGSDAAASPYLQLGMLIFAGVEGIKRKLPPPALSSGDPGEMSETQRAFLDIRELPHSLPEALEALEVDRVATGWLGPELSKAYLMHKRGEFAMIEGADMAQLCHRYALVY